MIESLRNIFAIPDLRKRLMFTFGLLAVYRIGCHIPTPGVDPQALIEFMTSMQSTFLGFVNTFTGGSLERVAVFALGIMPYITSSIILQLLTVVWPYLEKLSKEGELGRKKITQYTRYGTVLVSIIQSTGIALFLEKTTTPGRRLPRADIRVGPFDCITILTLTTGCAFVMWLGEQISERGIGNGISLIIFAGIVVGLPGAVASTVAGIRTNELSLIGIVDADRLHGSRRRLHRLHGAGAKADSGAVRQAHGRAQGLRRPEHLSAAAGQHRGRHSGDLREFPDGPSGDGRADVPGRPGCRRSPTSWRGDSRCTTCSTSSGSSSSATSTSRSSSTRAILPRTCGSTGASFPVSDRARRRPSTSTGFSRGSRWWGRPTWPWSRSCRTSC